MDFCILIIRDNEVTRARADNRLYSTLAVHFFVFSLFYLHITATFVEGFVTRLEEALSDNSCLGIS